MRIHSMVHQLLLLLLVSASLPFVLMEKTTEESMSSGRSFFSFEDSVYSTYYNIFHDGNHPPILLGGRRDEENEAKGLRALKQEQITERIPSAEPLVDTTSIPKSSPLPKVFFNNDRSKIIFSPLTRRSRRPYRSRRPLKFGTKLRRRKGFSSLKNQRRMFNGDRLLYSLGQEDVESRQNRDITTTTSSRPKTSESPSTFTLMNPFESLKLPIINHSDSLIRKNVKPFRKENDQDNEFRTTENSYSPSNETPTTVSDIMNLSFTTERVQKIGEDTILHESSFKNQEDIFSNIHKNETMVQSQYENNTEISSHENVFPNESELEEKINLDETEFQNESLDKTLRAKTEQVFPSQTHNYSEIQGNEKIKYSIPVESITTFEQQNDSFNQSEASDAFNLTLTTNINNQTDFDAKLIETTTKSQQIENQYEENIGVQQNTELNTFEHTTNAYISEQTDFDARFIETTTNSLQFLNQNEDNTVIKQGENMEINAFEHTTTINIDDFDTRFIETTTNNLEFANQNEENVANEQEEKSFINAFEHSTATNITESPNFDVNFIKTTTNGPLFSNQYEDNIVTKQDESSHIDTFEHTKTTNNSKYPNPNIDFIETTTNSQQFSNHIEDKTVIKHQQRLNVNEFEHTTLGALNEQTNIQLNENTRNNQSEDFYPTTLFDTTIQKHQESIFPVTNQNASSILNEVNVTRDSSLNLSEANETSFTQSFEEESQIVPSEIRNNVKYIQSKKIHNSEENFILAVPNNETKDLSVSQTFIANPSQSVMSQDSHPPKIVTLNATNSTITGNTSNIDKTIHNLDVIKTLSDDINSTRRSDTNHGKVEETTRVYEILNSKENKSKNFSFEEVTTTPVLETSTSYSIHSVDISTENTIHALDDFVRNELFNNSRLLSNNYSIAVETTTQVPGIDISNSSSIIQQEIKSFDLGSTAISESDIEIVDETLVNTNANQYSKGIDVIDLNIDEVTTTMNNLSKIDEETTSIETTTLFLKELINNEINQNIRSTTKNPQPSRTNNVATTNKYDEESLKIVTDIFLPFEENEPVTFQRPTQNNKVYLDSDEPLVFSTLENTIDPIFDDIDFEVETEHPNSSMIFDNGIVKFSIATFINEPGHSNASQINENIRNSLDVRSSVTTTKPNFNFLIRNKNAAFADQVQERSFDHNSDTNNTYLKDSYIPETREMENSSPNKFISDPIITTTYRNLTPDINPMSKSNNTQRVDMGKKLIELNQSTNSSNASIPLKKHSHILNKLHAQLKDISEDQLQLIEDEVVDLITILGPDINLDVMELRHLLNSSTNKRSDTLVEAIMRNNALRAKANLLQSKRKVIIESKSIVIPEPLKTILKNYGNGGLGQILSIMSIKDPEGMAELLSEIFEYDTLNDKEKTVKKLMKLILENPEAVGGSFSTLIANTLKNVDLSASISRTKVSSTTSKPSEPEPLTIAPATFLSTLIQFIKGGALSHKDVLEELINSGLLPVEVTNIGRIPIIVGVQEDKKPLEKETQFENVNITDPNFDYEEFDLNSIFETTERPDISTFNRNIEFTTVKSKPKKLNPTQSTVSNMFDYDGSFQQTTTSSFQTTFDNNIRTNQGLSEPTTTDSSKEDVNPSTQTFFETTTISDFDLGGKKIETTQSPFKLFKPQLDTTQSSLNTLGIEFEATTTRFSSPSVSEHSFLTERSINLINELSQTTQSPLTTTLDDLETTTVSQASISTPFVHEKTTGSQISASTSSVYETTQSSLIDLDDLTTTQQPIMDTTESSFLDSTTPFLEPIKTEKDIFSIKANPSISSEVEEFIVDQLSFSTLSPLKMNPINSDVLRYKPTTISPSSKISKADSFGIFPTQTLKPISTRTTIINALKMKQPLFNKNDPELDALMSVLRLYKQGIISDSEFLELMHELEEKTQPQMLPRIDDVAPRFKVRPAPQKMPKILDDPPTQFSHEFISNFPNAFSEFSQDYFKDQFTSPSVGREDQHSYASRDYFSAHGKAKQFQTFSYTNHPPYPREPFGPPQ